MIQPTPTRELTMTPLQTTPVDAEDIARRVYGIDGTATLLEGECDRNFRLSAGANTYILKLSPPEFDPDLISLQSSALRHLEDVAPRLPVPRVVPCRDADFAKLDNGVFVRLMTWLEGIPVIDVDRTLAHNRMVAEFAANVSNGMRGFHHSCHATNSIWNLSRALNLKDWVEYIDDAEKRQLAVSALELFGDGADLIKSLRSQFVHNDIHHHNLLVSPSDTLTVTGLLDFGDLMFAPLVNELAISIAHQLYGETDVLGIFAEMVAAFHQVVPLTETEISLLHGLVAARLASREIIVNRRVALTGAAGSYNETVSLASWAALANVMALDRQEVERRLRQACGLSDLS